MSSKKRRAYWKAYYEIPENYERKLRLIKDRYQKNKNGFRDKVRAYYQNHKEKWNARKLRELKFGVSYPTWWLCDLCSIPISGRKICLDHNHKTGRFRGWLCITCNAVLGIVEKLEFDISQFEEYAKGEYPPGVSP